MQRRRLFLALLVLAGCRSKEPPHVAAAAAPPPPRIARLAALPPDLRATESTAIAAATLDGRRIVLVADADDHAVVTLDAATLAPLARTDVGTAPRDLLVLDDGTLLATLPDADAVAVLEPAGTSGELHVARKVGTSTEPLAMAASLDGATIAVTCGAAHRVDVLDGRTLTAKATHDVRREPRAAVFSRHGTLFVSHATDDRLTMLPLASTAPTPPEKGASLGIPNATTGVLGMDPPRIARHANALVRLPSADGERILVPVVQQAPKGGAPPGGGYGGGSGFDVRLTAVDFDGFSEKKTAVVEPPGAPNRMSAFDVRSIDVATARPTAFPDRGDFALPTLLRTCLLPRAAIATSEKRLLVACSGESEVLEIDATASMPRVLARVTTARGPSALARIDETHAVVWSPLARVAQAIDTTAAGDREATATRELARVVAIDDKVLRGRELFHRTGDPRIAKDGLACATCHPDGRDDGIVWASPKGDRRTRTLAGNASRMATFGWGGEHATIDVHVKETMKRLRGTGLPQSDLDDLFAYVRAMKPLRTADVPREPAEIRGAALFASERAACATCHDPASGYTDHEKHDLYLFGAFVTPSLVGVGARRTLFHNGEYGSLEQLLDGRDRMGGLDRLTAEEKQDLAAFLRTL